MFEIEYFYENVCLHAVIMQVIAIIHVTNWNHLVIHFLQKKTKETKVTGHLLCPFLQDAI